MRSNLKLLSAIMFFIGGLLWIVFGTRLALSPAGDPSLEIYRDSYGTMVWLGIGMLFITIGVSFFYRIYSIPKGIAKITIIFIQTGGIFYFLGHSLRQFLDGGWEPAAPIGFILLILGMFVFSFRGIQLKSIPVPVGYSILLSSLCLLLFNDQFITAWMAVPFGIMWVIIGGLHLKSP